MPDFPWTYRKPRRLPFARLACRAFGHNWWFVVDHWRCSTCDLTRDLAHQDGPDA